MPESAMEKNVDIKSTAQNRRPCIVCGSVCEVAYAEKVSEESMNDFTYSSRKIPELMHYEYQECKSCQLLFTSDTPEHSELIKAYEVAAYDSAVESHLAAKTYLKKLQKMIGTRISSILDVGCGDGAFLQACIEGGLATVEGIEPSTAAFSSASSDLSQRIFKGSYDDYETSEKFDVVTLFQTIEHIRDPIGFLKDSQKFLRPGGFVAVACHDYTALPNKLLKDKSPIFDIEHLQVFSPESISRAMTMAGLRNVRVEAYANTYPVSYWLRLSPVPRSFKESRFLTNKLTRSAKIMLPVGNIMAIGQV